MRAELECVVPQNSIALQETVRKSPRYRQGHHLRCSNLFKYIWFSRAVGYVTSRKTILASLSPQKMEQTKRHRWLGDSGV